MKRLSALRRQVLYPPELRARVSSLLILKYFIARRVLHSVISATTLSRKCGVKLALSLPRSRLEPIPKRCPEKLGSIPALN